MKVSKRTAGVLKGTEKIIKRIVKWGEKAWNFINSIGGRVDKIMQDISNELGS